MQQAIVDDRRGVHDAPDGRPSFPTDVVEERRERRRVRHVDRDVLDPGPHGLDLADRVGAQAGRAGESRPLGPRRQRGAREEHEMPGTPSRHPSGDAPLQGDDSHVHTQNVVRGGAGMGKYALRCVNCHQLENVAGANMPPGAPNWRLPSSQMKLVFQGKSAGELCRHLKDPKQNGGRTVVNAIEHLEKDRLVLWGWAPGDGRSTPPLSHEEFARKIGADFRGKDACEAVEQARRCIAEGETS